MISVTKAKVMKQDAPLELLLWLSGISHARPAPMRSGSIPGLAQYGAVSGGVSRRCSSCPKALWLWLWCRPEAVAPIGPPSLEPPWGTGAALKKKERRCGSRNRVSKERKSDTKRQDTIKMFME